MNRFLPILFFVGLPALTRGEDAKIKEKVFLSKYNTIQTLHMESIGTVKYAVFRFKRKLDSKLSKGKGAGEMSNFGDSASTYCYKKESDMSDFEKTLLPEWFKGEKELDLTYTCGEIGEEEKRKNFPGFAETNCQCLDFTFDVGRKGQWPKY